MNTTPMDTTPEYMAAAGSTAGMIVIVVGGLLVTAALVWSLRLGARVLRREQLPHRSAARTRPPRSGPVGEERQMREPSEVPRATEGHRPTPHELGNSPDRPSGDQDRPRWRSGSSGSFGGGGGGAT
ncbi:DUF6479 family protein [Streptomyces sp. NPDC102462]|uniref:DUF6479 family protein n=1 Tax=Streptomyces sp. NPDC102462 TaxID=3366178 RepID=UPI003818DA4B